jgi:hypothetical protein
MRFPWDEALAFDRAILELSGRLGRNIDRTHALRGLAKLFVADEQLQTRAIEAAGELPPELKRTRGDGGLGI